jgi:hypothetical protein
MTIKGPTIPSPPDNPLRKIREKIKVYDVADLLATVAALQLVPENADHMVRIEALTQAVSSVPIASNKPRIPLAKLQELLNSPPLSDEIAMAEDPFPNPFVEEVPFFGGSYRVFPGLTDGATFVLRNIANALFRGGKLSKDFLGDAYIHLRAFLAVSDRMLKIANLTRGLRTKSSDLVIVPKRAQLSSLREAVTLSRKEVEGMLQSHSTALDALDVFTRPLAQSNLEEFKLYEEGPKPLLAKPLIACGDTLIVSAPEGLMTAATNYVISSAVRHHEVDAFAELYLHAVFRSVLLSLKYLGSQRLEYDFQIPLAISGCKEALFRIDNDKFMYLLLLVDTLDTYQVDEVSGVWETPGLEKQIAERFKAVEAEIYSKWPAPNELLCLLVSEGVGRAHMMGFKEDVTSVSEFLYINAHDLETIALLEGGNHLAVWRFARQHNLIRKTTEVFAWSTLDEFGLYRKNKYSYYLSDEKPYNVISISPDYSAPLRCEVATTHDRHTVPHHRPGHYIEVATVHGSSKIPLYQPMPPSGKKIECYIEEFPIPIWIVGAVSSRDTNAHSDYYEFCTAVAYWLWQLAPSLKPLLVNSVQSLSHLTVYLKLPDNPESITDDTVGEIDEAPISIATNASAITLDLKPSLSGLLFSADNTGERKIISSLLEGLRQVVPELSGALADDKITAMIDKHAPLGPKKMILLFGIAENPKLDPRSLPRYRAIQEAALDDVLMDVGYHLTKTLSISSGSVPKDKRNDLLQEVVKYCYKEFARLVSTLDPSGLLEWLVRQHEAVVRQDTLRRLTMTTRVACFQSDPELISNLGKELSRNSQTALAGRFLIEYVVACPPSGLRRISDGLIDRLRALAYEIITFGMHSDSVKYELTDMQLSILDSGRLGIVDNRYKSALDAHSKDFTTVQIAIESRMFSRHWKPQTRPIRDKPEIIIRADAACEAEFDFSMSDLVNVAEILLNMGYEIDPGAAVAPLNLVVTRLVQELQWTTEKVEKIMDFLSLNERSDFLMPPPEFRREHLYPWRFNRPLSYIRKPLLLRRTGDSVEVIWGNRHLESSCRNFVSVVMGGRLQPKSPEMKMFMGKMRNQEGKEFNDKVAKFFQDRPDMVVKRRVMTIGNLNLANLGDIDVLSADLRHRALYVVECKDLSMARTPFELASEIRELMVSTDTEKSIVEKHMARVGFARKHLHAIVQWLGGNSNKSWKVFPMIVVDEPLMAPRIQTCPLPVVAIELLEDHLQ